MARGRPRCRTVSLRETSASRKQAARDIDVAQRAQNYFGRELAVSRSWYPRSCRCTAVIFRASALCGAVPGEGAVHVGPASTRVRSMTRTPATGQVTSGGGSGPRRVRSVGGTINSNRLDDRRRSAESLFWGAKRRLRCRKSLHRECRNKIALRLKLAFLWWSGALYVGLASGAVPMQ